MRSNKEHSHLYYKIFGVIFLIFGVPFSLMGLIIISSGGVILLVPSVPLVFFGIKWVRKAKQLKLARSERMTSVNSYATEEKRVDPQPMQVYEKTRLNPDGLPPERAYTLEQAQNCFRIMDDCSYLLQSTMKPDTFFSRLDLMKQQIEYLKEISQNPNLTFSSPIDELEATLNQESDEMVYDFIVRYYEDMATKADELKTDKGRRNRYQKFFDTLDSYSEYLNERNRTYLSHKKQEFEEKFPQTE